MIKQYLVGSLKGHFMVSSTFFTKFWDSWFKPLIYAKIVGFQSSVYSILTIFWEIGAKLWKNMINCSRKFLLEWKIMLLFFNPKSCSLMTKTLVQHYSNTYFNPRNIESENSHRQTYSRNFGVLNPNGSFGSKPCQIFTNFDS